MKQMSRRERIRAAINREPVDRVPYAVWRHFPAVDRSPAGLAQATTRETASARVAVPWRIGAGSPAARATATSVWIGFQIRAHSVYTCAAPVATSTGSVQRTSVPGTSGGGASGSSTRPTSLASTPR